MNVAPIAYTLVASPEHKLPGHPESPNRFQYFNTLTQAPFSDHLKHMDSKAAPTASVTTVHPSSYLEMLEQASARGPSFVDYGDTYVTSASYQAALEAAGGAMAIVDAIVNAQAGSGFALVRPPGHHATATRAMGFCLLNNIAIAARHAQSLGLKRVMIVDFDVHHGNGTQDIFENDPDVLYLSTHQAGIYPGTGMLGETGSGEGEGSVVNIPLPARSGDQAFASICEWVINPIANRFKPDIILVSAGFDAHWNDPLASLTLSTNGFYELGLSLINLAKSICQRRIIFFLEGGYDPEALMDNVMAIFHALSGTVPPEDRLGPAPFLETKIDSVLENVISIHGL
jgi:acetoin utilization deacetylase AcuC-like enzyme